MRHLLDRDFDALTARSALICLWIAGAIVMVPAVAVPASARFYALEGVLLLTSAAVLTALRRRIGPRLTTSLILVLLALVVISATWLTGGPSSPALRSYTVAVVGGYWLIYEARGATIATLLTMAGMAGITWASTHDLLPPSLVTHTPWSLWLTTSAACGLLAVVQRLEHYRVGVAFAAAHAELERSAAAEAQAARSERRFAEVVATVPGVVYEFQMDAPDQLRFTFVSEGARRVFDVAPEAIVRDAGTLFAMVDPPSQLPGLMASIATAHATQAPWEIDGVVRTPAGKTKWIRGQAVPTTHADGSVRWHGVLTDQTARRTAEQALRESQKALKHSLSLLQSAFESTADGLLVVDLDGRVTSYNQKFVAMWRIPAALEATADDRQMLEHAAGLLADPQTFQDVVQDLYQRPEAVSFDTVRLKDGRCFERYSQPQRVEGAVVGRVWSFRDVTSRLEEERRRAELEDQLQQAQTLEALGTLSGGIAHDFNNLLTVIMGHAEAAQFETDDERRRENLETIGRASLNASALVRQIREFSQPRPTEREVLAVAQSIGSAIALLRTTMPKSIDLTATLDPAVTMFANATQVQQVVTNLVVNAAQAIGTTGGRIIVTLDEVPAAGAPELPGPGVDRYARLTVRDTGKGIAADLLPRIFDPFFTTKTASPGSGLGLAVVQGIVRRHAGTITVDSHPGDGTTVQVFWPALPPAATVQPAPAAPVATATRGEGRRILVVDDEPGITNVVAQSLRRMGYAVSATTDPREALEVFQRDPSAFDAVLSDVSMPGLSGVELGRQLLARRPDLPIVLFTGYSAGFGADDARAMGFRAVLSKPVTAAVLAEALHRALNGNQATTR